MLRVNGFYGHVRRNDWKSVAMFGGFAVAFQLIAAVLLILPLMFFDMKRVPLFALGDYLLTYAPLMFLLSIGLFLIGFALHTDQVRAQVGFVHVDRRSHARLVNLVERVAIAAGIPRPKVAIIPSDARNAFACGHGASSATVAVTRGLVAALDDDELAAVVAHEVAHIKNGDIRLMACANIMLGMVLAAEKLNPLRATGKRQGCAMFMPAVLLLLLLAQGVAKLAVTVARMSRLAVSGAREFVADAEAVRLTHNPAALISALRKVEGRSTVDGVDARLDAMMIDGASEGEWASHPTIGERIRVLAELSGSMALAVGPRQDTRPVQDLIAHRPTGGFGRKGLRADAAFAAAGAIPPAEEKRALWTRVTDGKPDSGMGWGRDERRLLHRSVSNWILFGFGLSLFAAILS